MVTKTNKTKKATLSSLIKQDVNRLREYCSATNFKMKDGKLQTLEDVLKELAQSKAFQQVLKTMIVSECKFGENALSGRHILEIYFDNDETKERKDKALNSAFVDALGDFAEYLKNKRKHSDD